MSKDFSLKTLCKIIFVILFFLYASCTGHLYKKGAVAFNKATLQTINGYEKIIDEYEEQGVILKARKLDGSQILKEADLPSSLCINSGKDIASYRFLLKALKDYSEALSALALIGSAKEVSKSLTNLGDQLDRLNIPKAKAASKLVGSLANIFIDIQVGAKIRKRIIEADPVIQEIVETLVKNLKLIKPSLGGGYSSEWNRLRRELNQKSKLYQEFSNSSEKVRLIFRMQEQLHKKENIPELANKTLECLVKMKDAHNKLANRAKGTSKAVIIDELVIYLNEANTLADLLDDLEL